jgi:23S rRNA maturation mini-RNase III
MLLNMIDGKFEANQSELYDNERLAYLGDQMLDSYLKVIHTPKEQRLINDIRQSRNQIDPRDYLSLISIFLYDCFVYVAAR